MRLSVIIPVRDDARVARCVDSVLTAAAGLEHETQVIVVDNASGAALQPVLQSLPAGALRLSEPVIGPFAARNRGLEFATGDVILFTDAACVVRPDWLRQAIAGLRGTGAGILQGYSGSLGGTALDRLIQSRYDSRFQGLQPGTPVECDTRNLAVRREVFDRLKFNDRWHRVGDTEFGLVAEQLGNRVAYWPAMRVDREHDADLRLFLAKQVSHGWGAQRLVRQMPDLPWHSGHPREIAGIARMGRIPGGRVLLKLDLAVLLRIGDFLGRRLARGPRRVELAATTLVDKLAMLLGHCLYEAGADEPRPAELLKGRLRWKT